MQSQSRGSNKTKDNGKPKSKCRDDQSSLDCQLVRVFIAQLIRNTPVPNHLLQRQREIEKAREREQGMPTSQGGA